MKMSLEATGKSELSSFHLRRVADRAVAASASYADVIVLAENIKIDTVIALSQCFELSPNILCLIDLER